jgi:predicted phosphodiesterase
MKLQNRTDVFKLGLDIERVVFLGDPHGDVDALEQVLELETSPNTAFVSVGDNIGYASANKCSALIETLKAHNIPSVWGNHEHWSKDDGTLFMMKDPKGSRVLTEDAVLFCKSLPRKIKIESEYLPDKSIYVQHSIFDTKTQEWDWITSNNASKFVFADIVVTGHSHKLGLHIISKDTPVVTVSLSSVECASFPIQHKFKYVLDSGSLARADGEYPGFKRGTYSVINLKTKTLEIKRFIKEKLQNITC